MCFFVQLKFRNYLMEEDSKFFSSEINMIGEKREFES